MRYCVKHSEKFQIYAHPCVILYVIASVSSSLLVLYLSMTDKIELKGHYGEEDYTVFILYVIRT